GGQRTGELVGRVRRADDQFDGLGDRATATAVQRPQLGGTFGQVGRGVDAAHVGLATQLPLQFERALLGGRLALLMPHRRDEVDQLLALSGGQLRERQRVQQRPRLRPLPLRGRLVDVVVEVGGGFGVFGVEVQRPPCLVDVDGRRPARHPVVRVPRRRGGLHLRRNRVRRRRVRRCRRRRNRVRRR